jgi:hypothetical protein
VIVNYDDKSKSSWIKKFMDVNWNLRARISSFYQKEKRKKTLGTHIGIKIF